MTQHSTLQSETKTASGAVAAHRCVGFDGAQATVAGQRVLGVSALAAGDGEDFAVAILGTAEVETGGAFAVGTPLLSDALGRAAISSANGQQLSGHVFALALEQSRGEGEVVEVLLVAMPNTASLIPIVDAGQLLAATNVESALAEIAGDSAAVLRAELASDANGVGASLVAIEDAANQIAATDVEGALTEIVDAAQLLVSDLASVANAKGASKIGIEDAANQIAATTAEGALTEIVDAAQAEAITRAAIVTDLASVANAKGASLVGVEDADDLLTGNDVESCLVELAALKTGYHEADSDGPPTQVEMQTAFGDKRIGLWVDTHVGAVLPYICGRSAAAGGWWHLALTALGA